MAKVVEIRPDPDENVISILEDLLEMAKQGEILSIGVATVKKEGRTATRYACDDLLGLMGITGQLLSDLQERYRQNYY